MKATPWSEKERETYFLQEYGRLRAVVAAREETAGWTAPATLEAQYELHAYAANHPVDAPPDLTLEMVATCLSVLGPDHPTTIGFRVLWAHEATEVMAGTGDGQATWALESMVARQTELLGPDHARTLSLLRAQLQQQSRAYKLDELALAEYPQAAQLMKAWSELVDKHITALGADHLDTMECREMQAGEACEFGLHGDEVGLYALLAADRARVQGPYHANTLETRAAYVASLAETGDPIDLLRSEELHPALLADCLRVLGRNHPVTQSSLESAR
ncbi:hypothetical protein ACFYPC_06860 [Streptomyces sp. NPDC005808]|uniref:hypothetical protein n=1 Tax=Streptomyces sp. NPDC005808 TaxID=3364734 RepID=UPI0036A3036E